MTSAIPKFTPEESARLTKIWDRLYELYVEKANGSREPAEIQSEIDALIQERDAIRPWGWNTGVTGSALCNCRPAMGPPTSCRSRRRPRNGCRRSTDP